MFRPYDHRIVTKLSRRFTLPTNADLVSNLHDFLRRCDYLDGSVSCGERMGASPGGLLAKRCASVVVRALAAVAPGGCPAAEEVYGNNSKLRQWLYERRLEYVVAVASDHVSGYSLQVSKKDVRNG